MKINRTKEGGIQLDFTGCVIMHRNKAAMTVSDASADYKNLQLDLKNCILVGNENPGILLRIAWWIVDYKAKQLRR